MNKTELKKLEQIKKEEQNKLVDFVVNEILDLNPKNLKEWFKDLQGFGCISGMIPSLIYPRDFIKLFKKLNIPLLDGFDKSKFSELIDTNPSHKYKLLQNDTQKTVLFIRDTLNL